MIKIVLSLAISFSFINAVVVPTSGVTGQSVVPNDKTYYIHKQGNIEIIYTKDNAHFAKHTSKLEPSIHEKYELFYDWVLDERLSVGLISDHNQIANGFSTQFSNNRQINYIGGSSYVDYFTSTSWLDTLLYHETAHNYQTNVKASSVSQLLHSIFGNGSFYIPTFTIPNLTENAFMLEGNAVLNESWHGNGGRLYSGRFYAQTILQAKADKLKAGELYNTKVEFPYGEVYYIQGGFYNLFMAEKYGLKSINSYFKYHSEDWWWPFFTNASMTQATGVDFEDSLKEYSDEYKKLSESLVMAEGISLASSQFFYSLNSDEDEIYFLINESGTRASELVQVNKRDMNISKNRESYSPSKVLKVDGEYFTQSSANTSPTKILQGLYDSDKFIKKGSSSKMIQGYLSDGREVYFDVPLSYSEPQLFIDGEFYAKVNSSVLIDKHDNIYYFVQNAKKRTLYKNKTPLMSLNAYYSIVSDVDSGGGIYFIANSKYGSSLYLYKDSHVSRVSKADNIIEAKLINDKEILIAAISEKDYYYVKSNIQNIDETPFEVKLFFEDKEYFANTKEQDIKNFPDAKEEYNSFIDMRYSGLDFSVENSASGDVVGLLNLKFADPLGQNAINAFVSRDVNNVTIAGAGYESALNILRYGLYGYGVVDNSQEDIYGNNIDVRESGVIAFGELPYYKSGYYEGLLNASYYQDYDTISREPLSVSMTFRRYEIYGKSMYTNYLNSLKVYAAKERDDKIFGSEYNFKHDLLLEFYISLDAKYSQTSSDMLNSVAQLNNRGVKLSTSSYSSDLDSTAIGMRSIAMDTYNKNAGYVDVGLKKVFNFSSYWFTFPVSLQREAINVNYKYFTIEDFADNIYNVAEIRAGITASIVLMNKLVVPMQLEYVYNDTIFAKEKNQLFFALGLSF